MASSPSTINSTENANNNIPITPVIPNPTAPPQNIPAASLSHFAQLVPKLTRISFLVWRGLLEPFLKATISMDLSMATKQSDLYLII
jgi:hypothetical protein